MEDAVNATGDDGDDELGPTHINTIRASHLVKVKKIIYLLGRVSPCESRVFVVETLTVFARRSTRISVLYRTQGRLITPKMLG